MNRVLPPEALEHYEVGLEAGRLASGHGVLELARTKEILERWLPPAPAVVVDVGGGPGPTPAGSPAGATRSIWWTRWRST